MSIITISRGSYSRGVDISNMLAEKLGYRCLARDVLIKASKEFNIPEYNLTQALDDAPSMFERFTLEKDNYISYIQAALIDHFVDDNIVYHGQVGHFLVKDIPHVIKIRIIADLEYRIKFVMERDGMTKDKAIDVIENIDRSRKKWCHYFYGIDIEDPSHYDVVLNTEKLSLEKAVDIIYQMATWKKFQTTPESQKKIDDLALSLKASAVDALESTEESNYWRHL